MIVLHYRMLGSDFVLLLEHVRFTHAREKDSFLSSYRRLPKVIADDERCSHGRGQGGWRFRADGDVEAFIEDDLRTGPWIFGTFLPFSLGGIAVGRGREGRGEAGGAADRKNWRVLLASRPWRLPRRTTHIVASRKGRSRKIARGMKER